MKRYFWTNKETAIVAEYYQSGGIKACLPLLPRRTQKGIYQQARKMGLMFGNNKPRPRKRWSTTERIDRLIIDCYRQSPERGALKKLAKTIARPYWWVKSRAQALGAASVALAGNKEPQWSEAELVLLQKNSCKHPMVISRIFKANGFQRSPTAIVVKRKRLKLDTVDIGVFTARQLAEEFGVDPKVVTGWIRKGWLKAGRKGTARQNPDEDAYRIKRRHIREFVVESVGGIDIRKVDKVWFVDLLANP